MIRRGRKEDRTGIFDLYGRSNSLGFVNREDYFARKFVPENVVVNEINGHICASVQVDFCPLMVSGRKLAAGWLLGQFYDYSRGTKDINALIAEVSEQQKYRTLITIIPTDSPKDYGRYGFEEIYRKRVYTISRSHLANASYKGVTKDFTIDDLMKLYDGFVSHFNGYVYRDRGYWNRLIELLRFKRYNLAVYYDEENKPQGYMIYYIEAGKVSVVEIIYNNGIALTRLVCYALRLKSSIRLFTSENEDLTKAFPKVRYRLETTAVARVNDLEMFNRLYNCQAHSSREAFALGGKPLYLSEEYY